jgi:predicted nucleic acid-binding protein
MIRIFADTHFYLAILSERDTAHRKATRFLARREPFQIITTTAVLAELGNAMTRPVERGRFVRFVDQLRGDPRTRVLETGAGLFWRGLDLYRKREDKEWSLTDCISFVVMSEEGILDALTGDHHFEQAGFVALLK